MSSTAGTPAPRGPVPPTGRSTTTDYVYVMEFQGDEIIHTIKIWHAGLAMQELDEAWQGRAIRWCPGSMS